VRMRRQGRSPPSEPILTMRPLLFLKYGSASRDTRNGPRVFEAKIASHCVTVIFSNSGGLVIRGVVHQHVDATQFPRHFFFTISRTFFSSVTSQRAASASTPCDANSATTARASRADS